jgi:hypothetical protein
MCESGLAYDTNQTTLVKALSVRDSWERLGGELGLEIPSEERAGGEEASFSAAKQEICNSTVEGRS